MAVVRRRRGPGLPSANRAGSRPGCDSAEAAGCTHEELEARLDRAGRELICQLLQDHLDLRATRERRAGEVVDGDGVAHRAVEAGHRRSLETIFGPVTVTRLAYRAKQAENLYLQDAALNLPAERHSHGLRQRCAIEAEAASRRPRTRSSGRRATACLSIPDVFGVDCDYFAPQESIREDIDVAVFGNLFQPPGGRPPGHGLDRCWQGTPPEGRYKPHGSGYSARPTMGAPCG